MILSYKRFLRESFIFIVYFSWMSLMCTVHLEEVFVTYAVVACYRQHCACAETFKLCLLSTSAAVSHIEAGPPKSLLMKPVGRPRIASVH